MTIIVLKDKERKLPLRAIVRRKGHPAQIKHFPLTREGRADAKNWVAEQERSIRNTGQPLPFEELNKRPVSEIVDRYLAEITPSKASQESETIVLERFKEFVRDKSLAAFGKQDAWAFINKRLKDTWRGKRITPRTVSREKASIQHVFEIAREQWGYTNLPNHFSGIKIKGSTHRRRRRLERGELELLVQACRKCLGLNRLYVPLAIYLAVETGMRLDEIFNLTWEDLDIENRRIEIIKSKTDHVAEYSGRTIVMSARAMVLAFRLPVQLEDIHGKFSVKPSDRVFPMTKDAFEQSFDDVLKRAGIKADKRGERLQFRDLRREASSRFEEMGLTKSENELMMGHTGQDTNSIYQAPMLRSVQNKLDRYYFENLKEVGPEGGLFWDDQLEQLFSITRSADGGITFGFPSPNLDDGSHKVVKRKGA